MARRAKSSVSMSHIGLIFGGLILFVGGGWFLSQSGVGGSGGKGKSGGGNLTTLSVRDFMDGSSSMRGNSYRIKGRIDSREDDWPATDGRMFSIAVEEDNVQTPLPLLVPPKFNGENIQRNQEYSLKVSVNDSGVLVAEEFLK